MHVEKIEVIYYELVKMEDRITQKAQAVLDARSEIEQMLKELKVLINELKEVR